MRASKTIFGILFIMVFQISRAVIGEKKLTNNIQEGITPYLFFGFKGGGSINEEIRYSPDTTPIYLFFCKSEEVRDIYKGRMQLHDVLQIFNQGTTLNRATDDCYNVTEKMKSMCEQIHVNDNLMDYYLNFDYQNKRIIYDLREKRESRTDERFYQDSENLKKVPYFDREVHFKYDIKDKDSGFYVFFISHCQQSIDEIGINYTVVNPGGEHLSVDLIPNKLTYLVFFITWICVLLISSAVVSLRVYKRHDLSYICLLILLSYFIITSYLILRYIYWRNFSKNGKVNIYFEGFLNFIEVFSIVMYLIIIHLVGSGYKIISNSFSCYKCAKNIAVMLCIGITSLFLRYTSFILLIFFGTEVIIMVIFLRCDIQSCIRKLKRINSELNPIFVEERDIINSNNNMIKYYKCFIVYLLIYSFMEMTIMCLRPFFAIYHEWIFVLAQQAVNLVSMTFLFVTLTYSIKFKKFEGLNDGALVAPNPYFKNKSLKICGEIIVIKSEFETEKSALHLGIESDSGINLAEPVEKDLGERAKIYETSMIDFPQKMTENSNKNHLDTSCFEGIEDRYNLRNDFHGFDEECKEEQKAHTMRNDTEKDSKISEFPILKDSLKYCEPCNLFEAQNIIDLRDPSRNYEECKLNFKQESRDLSFQNGRKRSNSAQRLENFNALGFMQCVEEEKESSSFSFVSPDMINLEILL
ncbi:unnamed protein product [Moneuplotes crassus]|uniref:Uncharacterized protein n=1 Tax=Euplotes crassus TaxID=5936 RepID=A0AAD1UIM1_EUPCR|nr:unnamed protein product [Moneuplotes crassus]